MPNGDKFTLLSSGEVPSQISNGVVYNGRLWVYSFSTRKLYGIDLEGNGPIKAIPVTSITTDESTFKNQRLCYGEKNMGELVSLYASTSSSRYYTITSSPSGLFTTESRYTSTTITARGSVCPLNVVGEAKVLATFDTSTFPWASIAEVKTGCIKPNLPMPSSAKVFVDAAAYLWGKGIFLIFVGTGIIFSRTLEAGSFGYLDTTSVLGTITQFGWLGYSQDEQSLYILGQDTSNRVKLAKITLNTNFDYATDGAWLPMIVSDGLPAYIKAKETETE